MSLHNVTRRSFLQKAALAAAPCIIPAAALGAPSRGSRKGAQQQPAPSNRIVMGCIGLGGQGTGNMEVFLGRPQVQIVAVCDVDASQRRQARDIVDAHYSKDSSSGKYRGCAEYNDFRELLARPDIEAVSIATPDHWHALVAIAAAKAGKDMYAEKPLALTIHQGRVMSDTIRQSGVVFQTGSQQRSDRRFRMACELVRNERIGKLRIVKVGLGNGPSCGLEPEMPVPQGFDYDMWLGPAPWAPYTKNRCHWNFRWNLDYSGGQLTDWGAHNFDIAQWGMGTEYTGPVEVEGKGFYPQDGLWNAATKFDLKYRYANGVLLTCNDKNRFGTYFEGDEGWVYVDRGNFEAEPTSLLTSVFAPSEIHLYESKDHHGDFLKCVRSRREPIAPIEVAHRSITLSHLGNIAMKLERKLRWDPEVERFVDDPEADRMLTRAMRGPWSL